VFNIANERIAGTVREEAPLPGARVSDMFSGKSFAYSARPPQLRRRDAAHHENPTSESGTRTSNRVGVRWPAVSSSRPSAD